MTSWIESQPTLVIAAIVFGVVYLATAAVFLLAAWASRLPIGKHLGSLTPVPAFALGHDPWHPDRLPRRARVDERRPRARIREP